MFSSVFCKILNHIFLSTPLEWLLRIEGWISLKMAPVAIVINISNASHQREFIFFSYLISGYGKFVEISKSLLLSPEL